ncbi:MAG: squalene synthase HpnC [Planctomycetaceae bacterium]
MKTLPVVENLKHWGPEGTCSDAISLAEAQRYCRQLSLGHYENFPVVTWFLPRDVQPHFYAIYAYCRWADDLADEISDPAESLRLLNWWEDRFRDCFRRANTMVHSPALAPPSGQFIHPVFVALEQTIRDRQLPAEPFLDLISAFRQDQVVHEYQTFDDLRDYCRRSADPVGRLILHLFGLAAEQNLAWSDSICTGLQLANFWQDLGRDAARGRHYLPHEDRIRFGYEDADYANRAANAAFIELMTFEVERAEKLLLAGKPLVRQFPRRLRVDVELFIRGGLGILDHIRADGFRLWDRRSTLSKFDFLKLGVGSLWQVF